MQSIAQRLRVLAEDAPKYVDRDLIDYWRTIQGTPVGFHGKVPGQGVPIAGPPVLTGGSGSANPLLAPLLKKYPAKTFVGDAIRKKNFPLSLTVFFDNVLGDEQAIRKRMAELKEEYDKAKSAEPWLTPSPVKFLYNKFDSKQRSALSMITVLYQSPSGRASVACKALNSLGVSGTLREGHDLASDEAKSGKTVDQMLADLGTDMDSFKSAVRDMYLLNQVMYSDAARKKGYEKVTRGMGSALPGTDGDYYQSKALIEQAKQSGVSVRLAGNRAMSSTASGNKSKFCCFGFQDMPIPIEAVLSSWNGMKAQDNDFKDEKETVVLGIADLAIDPKYLTDDTKTPPSKK